MASESEQYYYPLQKNQDKSKRKKIYGRSEKEHYANKEMKEGHSQGHYVWETFEEAIIEVITCSQQSFPQVMKQQLKKIGGLHVETVQYQEILGYQLMAQLYYLEDKAKKAKLTQLGKLTRIKSYFQERIKAGLREFDHIKRHYQHLHRHEGKEEEIEEGKDELDGQE